MSKKKGNVTRKCKSCKQVFVLNEKTVYLDADDKSEFAVIECPNCMAEERANIDDVSPAVIESLRGKV